MSEQANPNQSPHQYKLERVLLESEKLGRDFNLYRIISEINIFEHIDKPYLTASIIISDNNNVITDIDILGTEKVTIELNTEIEGGSLQFTITKKFIITEIVAGVKSSDYQESWIINLIEDIGYISRLTRVSKSYTSAPSDIIKKIVNEFLGREVLQISKTEHKEEKPMKVIVPNMTPLESANWIKDRISTQDGMPFFLYSTLCDDKLRYVDLETVLKSNPLNIERPYTYSQTFGSEMAKYDKITQSYIIQGYKAVNQENQLNLSRGGWGGATYNFIDTTIGKNEISKFNINQVFQGLKSRGALKPDQNKQIYDDQALINGKSIHDYDTREITQISTSNIFTDNTYNYYESSNIKGHMLKPTAKAMRNFVHKSSIDINVAGQNFLYKDICKSIGTVITLDFKNTREVNPGEQHRDVKRSGEYMIYAARHVFSGQKYNVNLSCVKLANERPIS